MTRELTQWLRAQLDADERIAQKARDAEFCKDGRWVLKSPFEDALGSIHSEAGEALFGEEEDVPFSLVEHIALHDPVRVLREIDAKRKILEAHGRLEVGEFCSTCDAPSGIPGRPVGCDTVRLLALPYINRPGYRQEWRP